MNPAEIANQLSRLGVDLDAAVRKLAEFEEISVDTEGDYKVKYSRTFREAAGSVEDRKQIAVAACDQEWRTWGKAAAAVRLQKEHVRALHARIDVGRTLASTVRAEASLAKAGW